MQHILAGNPDKLGPLTITIRPHSWSLNRGLAMTVMGLTLPLMARYGYLRA